MSYLILPKVWQGPRSHDDDTLAPPPPCRSVIVWFANTHTAHIHKQKRILNLLIIDSIVVVVA